MTVLPTSELTGDETARPVDRRVRRTQKAIRDAFISLVLERGYDSVLIDDIADRADIGRATFYAHFSDKDDLFAQLFSGLSDELKARIAEVGEVRGSANEIRPYLVRMLYEDAYASRDLFRICLSGVGNGRARASYEDTVAEATASLFRERIKVSPHEARIPVEVMARVFAGAHVALLKAWLDDPESMSMDDAVANIVRLTHYGYAWGLGVVPDDFAAKMPALKILGVPETA